VVDVEPDQSAATIGVAGAGAEGKTLLLVHTGPGFDWVADKVKTSEGNTEVLEVALHPSGQAGVLIPELQGLSASSTHAAGLPRPRPRLHRFVTGVPLGSFEHVGQDELDAAVTRGPYSQGARGHGLGPKRSGQQPDRPGGRRRDRRPPLGGPDRQAEGPPPARDAPAR
jgi:hypothetical protein